MNSVLMAFLLLLVLLIFLIIWLIMIELSSSSTSREEISPYECGFDGKDLSRLPFSLRFFLMMIIYILLDVEVCLLLHLPYELSLNSFGKQIWFFTFMLLLLMGMCFEAYMGLLDWKK